MLQKIRRLLPNREIVELLAGTGMAQALTFLLLPFVSRVFDPVEYGLFSFYLSIGATISVVMTLRLEQVIPLEKELESLYRLLASVFMVLLGLTLVFVIIALPVCFLLRGRLEHISYLGVLLCVIAAVMSASVVICNFIAIRTGQLRLNSLTRILVSVINPIIAIVYARHIEPTYIGLFCGVILSNIISMVVFIFSLKILWRDVLNQLSLKVLKSVVVKHRKTIGYNLPNALLDCIQEYGIIFLLAFKYTPEQVGFYSFAYRIVKAPVLLITSSYGQVVYKVAIHVTNYHHLRKKLSKYLMQMMLVAVIAPIILNFYGEQLFAIFFGVKWVESGALSGYLAIWLFSTLLSAPFASLFFVLHKQETALFLLVADFLTKCMVLICSSKDLSFKTVLLLFAIGSAFWSIISLAGIMRLLKKRGDGSE